MEFDRNQPIYLQISTWLGDQLLAGRLGEGDKVPSVRELAVSLEVNPNTVARTYMELQHEGIIENRRGIGYFVAPAAPAAIRAQRRERFAREEAPRLFRALDLMGLDFEGLKALHDTWRNQQ